MGLVIGVAFGGLLFFGIGYLVYQGGKAERDIARAREHARRRKATVLSWHHVEKPKPGGDVELGGGGQDRRRVFITVHVDDGESYQAEPVWRFGGGDELEDGQEITVDVHADKPWVVWPVGLAQVDYWLGDIADVFYRKSPPTPAAQRPLADS